MKPSGLRGAIGAAALAALVAGGGCLGRPPEAPSLMSPQAPPASPSPRQDPPGSLSGRVRLRLTPDGTDQPLPQVFVFIKKGLEGRTYPVPPEPLALDQAGFQFVPHVFGIRAGQGLKISSHDPAQHNVFCQPFNNPGFNVTIGAGETYQTSFATPETMILFQCNIHKIMKAYAGVLPHPFFAVTGADGTFKIPGIPAGTYTLAAWQERMGIQTRELEVISGKEAAAEFIYQ